MFSGPGWFADILNVTICIDGPRIDEDWAQHMIPWHPFKGSLTMIETDSKITGKVIVRSLTKGPVYHHGVKIQIEEYVHFVDPFMTTDYLIFEENVSPAGAFDGVQELSFEIDLKNASGYWHETYHGKTFSLRHMATVTITRPWYALNVIDSEPFHMYLIEGKPSLTRSNTVTEVDSNDTESIAQSSSHSVDDFTLAVLGVEGVVELKMDHPSLDICGKLQAKLHLHSLTIPLVLAELVLIKGEYIDGDLVESIVFIHTIFGMMQTGQQKDAKLEEGVVGFSRGFITRKDENDHAGLPRVDDPVVFGATFDFEVKVQAVVRGMHGLDRVAELCPTFNFDPKLNFKGEKPSEKKFGEGKEKLGVRYFLRLHVEDAQGHDHWNTQEVILYRTAHPIGNPLELNEIHLVSNSLSTLSVKDIIKAESISIDGYTMSAENNTDHA